MICAYIWGWGLAPQHVHEGQRTIWESILAFYHMGPGNWPQVGGLSGRSLSHWAILGVPEVLNNIILVTIINNERNTIECHSSISGLLVFLNVFTEKAVWVIWNSSKFSSYLTARPGDSPQGTQKAKGASGSEQGYWGPFLAVPASLVSQQSICCTEKLQCLHGFKSHRNHFHHNIQARLSALVSGLLLLLYHGGG